MNHPEIEIVPISSPIPFAFNSKIHTTTQIDRIANSIQQFGFNAPLVLDEQNVILAGHGRFEAAKKLGLREVPVIRAVGLTDAQKKAFRIIDNKTASDTTYDLNNLELEVRALEEMQFDVQAFGFEEFKFTAEPPHVDEDEKKDDETGKWVGQIKLKVPAEEIDHFEADLDQLLKKYDGVSKETKRVK